ncbi:MAG: cell division protein ZapE [Acidimicrobiales bacterium]|nr:cell division protein ZapE [Acidimicrobiales bacterium]
MTRPHPVRLVDRRPALAADLVVARCVPPHRFADVRFDTYRPNPGHPSQAEALAAVRAVASRLETGADGPGGGLGGRGRGRFRRRRAGAESPGEAPGRYLDGGFGVGKTHLLAALWHESPRPSAYLTFAELAAVIGFLGMEAAVEAFAGCRLLCIDEFELDDVANTLMTVTFLRAVVGAGTLVVTTSNSLPDRLGEGRFHADDFRREIAAIASHFEVIRIDGPDYRAGQRVVTELCAPGELDSLAEGWRAAGSTVAEDRFDELLAHLRVVHPVQVGALLDGLDAVAVHGVHPIANQGDALLVVHLVDELYDAGLTVGLSGCRVDQLFPDTYRHGGYRVKYGRCESRLSALLAEAATAAAG